MHLCNYFNFGGILRHQSMSQVEMLIAEAESPLTLD